MQLIVGLLFRPLKFMSVANLLYQPLLRSQCEWGIILPVVLFIFNEILKSNYC